MDDAQSPQSKSAASETAVADSPKLYCPDLKESLTAARANHLLTILVAATLLAFAVSVTPQTREYAAAAVEFRKIYPALKRVNELNHARINRFYESDGVLKVLREELKALDTSKLEVMGVLADRFAMPVYGAGDKPSIEDLYNYLKLEERFEKLPVWHVDIESLRSGLRRFLADHPNGTAITSVYISGERPEGWNGEPFQYDPRRLSLAVTLSTNDGKTDTPFITSPNNPVYHTGMENLVPEEASRFLSESGLVVPRQRESYLLGSSYEDEIDALPALRNVWDSVKGSDVVTIVPILERKIKEEEKASETDLSLSGIKVKSTTAIAVGPTVLLVVEIYFLAHLLHLLRLAKRNPVPLVDFPWIALFSSWIGRSICYGSTIALPAGAVFSLVVVSNLSTDIKVLLCIGYGIIFLALGITASETIRRLRLLKVNAV